jgi:hypothetical protein
VLYLFLYEGQKINTKNKKRRADKIITYSPFKYVLPFAAFKSYTRPIHKVVHIQVSQKWRTNGALRCRRDYRKRQKNVKKILLDLFADLAVFKSGS